MKDRTIRVLEFHKIVEMLSACAISGSGRKLASALKPAATSYEIERGQQETSEALSIIGTKGSPPIGAFYDCVDYLSFTGKGGVLNMRQLLQILYNIRTAISVAVFLKDGGTGDTPESPLISELAALLSNQRKLANEIDRCIVSEEEMADNASPRLRALRRERLQKGEAVKAALNKMITGTAKQYLQDAIVTIRDGRYVLPVKQECSGNVAGIIHDKSSTGATYFIEPQTVVQLNNELRQIELEESIEIDRILGELSSIVAVHAEDLFSDFNILTKLDFIFAKAALAHKMNGIRPEIVESGRIKLNNARHPLIDAERVVPLNIEIGDGYNSLIITGPNTGGKTVSLKTVGLLTLMGQSGLHIPADEGSVLARFDRIYADVGDEQSIEQNLSTFSSHMKNIVDIISNADENTLILLDELGAGTDPTEGAALAISILENLRLRGCTVFATTHYTELKKYALITDGVENASMEFDLETLSPTYRLRAGLPGKSNAFEISKRLGLPENIIAGAGKLLDGGDVAFEDIISAIERDKKQTESERDEAIVLNISMKKKREELDKKIASFEREKEHILREARIKARAMIDEAADVSTEIKEELRKIPKLDNYAERNAEFDKSMKRIHAAADRYRESYIKPENTAPVDPTGISIGDEVRIASLDSAGKIISLPDSTGELTVDVGMARVKVNISDLTAGESGKKQRKDSKSSHVGERISGSTVRRNKIANISIETDVRGMRLEEAEMHVSKYLDDAYLAGLDSVRIIHGRGEGILQSGIRNMLGSNPHVRSFERGAFHDGGDGVTMVYLKKD